MNRYRTTPGITPSKASGTTTCQKCLQKGHYSYECKGGLQSRPYVSRASRTQQLRNPKLKPALSEVKLEGNDKQPQQPQVDAEKTAGKLDQPLETSDDLERPAKRQRRSPSISSIDSVSTISTDASEYKYPRREASRPRDRRSHNDRSRSPVRKRHISSSRSRSPPSAEASRRRQNDSSDSPPKRSAQRDMQRDRRSHSPPRQSAPVSKSAGRPPGGPRRERSLSPYSRRLALTQAMNMH